MQRLCRSDQKCYKCNGSAGQCSVSAGQTRDATIVYAGQTRDATSVYAGQTRDATNVVPLLVRQRCYKCSVSAGQCSVSGGQTRDATSAMSLQVSVVSVQVRPEMLQSVTL